MKIEKDAGAGLHKTVSRMNQAKSQGELAKEVDISDKVELSKENRLATNVLQRVKQTPSIRQDKVDSINAAIENDQYKVNVEQTVRAILKDNLLDELL